MKNPLHYIQKYPQRTKQILGITKEQFQDLLTQSQIHHQEHQAELERKKSRINKKGGGRKPKLELAEEVCLCLFYLRQMPTFEVLGLHFGVSKTEANDPFHYWLMIFRKILPASLLEQVEKHESDSALVLELLTEFRLIVDSSEQPRERPSEHQKQKEYFSGKKKQHTFKNQFIILPEGKDIVDVEVGKKGPKSDISWFRDQQKKFENEQMFQGDKAYQGGENITTPQKKTRQGELTAKQKEENKKLSSHRIFVEHVIKLIKVFRIAQQRFPLNSRTYEQIILTICGLVSGRKRRFPPHWSRVRLRIGALTLPGS